MNDTTQERADRFKDWMGVMVAIVALVTALAAWRGASAARTAGLEDYSALLASLNAEKARTLGTATAIEHLTAFTQFAINDELLAQLQRVAAAETTPERRQLVEAQLLDVERLAATNRNFFPGRYANQDGTYELDREIAELVADAEEREDLSPQPHLELAADLDRKTFSFTQVIIILSLSLLCFTIAGALHYERGWQRWGAAALGAFLLGVGALAVVLVESGRITL
jgi:hypothetical protein